MEHEARNHKFDFLRFVAATLVIVAHSYSLLNYHVIDYLGSIGVAIFFTISGYLITQSWLFSPHVVKFLVKRMLRIIPGLGICIFITVIIIGPLCTKLPFSIYFSHPATYTYLHNIFLYPLQFSLPDVFSTNKTGYLVNHSLWTLPVEFSVYLVLMIMGVIGILMKKRIYLLLVFLLIITDQLAFSFLPWYRTHKLYDIAINGIVSYCIYFFVGSICYLYRKQIPYTFLIFIFACAIFYFSFKFPVLLVCWYIAIPYIILYFVNHPIIKTSITKKLGDPSYGMYLYSMPIQQMLIYFFPFFTPVYVLVLSFVGSVMAGSVSWRFVEARILRLKKYI